MNRRRCVTGIVAAGLAVCVTMAGAADVAVVDMERLVKAHPKSEVNREILRDQLKELESERDAMVAQLEEKKTAFLDARKDAADPALGDAVRAEREEAVRAKLKELQSLEQEMGQRLMGRQREMNEQKLRMHKRVEDVVREMGRIIGAHPSKPSQPRYLDNTREPGKLLSHWNLIVPERILHRTWEELA